MTVSTLPFDDLKITRKVRVTGVVVFETGWRIGSGKEGETLSDLGVVLGAEGEPVLPGSSLKGKLRGTCEQLAHALGMTACLLNYDASGIDCTSDVKHYHRVLRREYQEAQRQSLADRLAWIDQKTCDVCKLFGSPVRAARVRCSDGRAETPGVVQVRDGVVLDRDSHTAVDGLKYDYEVVSAGSRFGFRLDLDNPSDNDLALLGAGLFEWHAGASIGGFTSRGLGRFTLQAVQVRAADLTDPGQRRRYLLGKTPEEKLTDVGDWQAYFTRNIDARLR
jgi:CRISPR-associated RAMP protein (TIGR02581 family)